MVSWALAMETFKQLAEVVQPDPRNSFFVRIDTGKPLNLAEHYAAIADISFNPNVPEEIRSYFATIQNVCLYAWFAYDFYAVVDFLNNNNNNNGTAQAANKSEGCKYLCFLEVAANWLVGNGPKTHAEVLHENAENLRHYYRDHGVDLSGLSDRQVVDFNKAVEGGKSSFVSGGQRFVIQALSISFNTANLQHEFTHAPDFGINGNWNRENAARFEKALRDVVNGPNTKEYLIEFRGQSGFRAFLEQPTGKAVIFDPSGNFRAAWDLGAEEVKGIVVNGKLW